MDAPDTVTAAVQCLAGEGYTADFQLIGGALRCSARRNECAVETAVVERLYRFEGQSDPGDEMIVFGLHDPETDTRGTLASAFGPTADPEMLDHLVGLASRHQQ